MKTKKTKTMARSVCAGALLLCCVVPAYATASDPLSIVNNLSDFIFSIIKASGIIILGWGIVAVPTAALFAQSVDRTILLNYNFHCVKPPKHTNKCLM